MWILQTHGPKGDIKRKSGAPLVDFTKPGVRAAVVFGCDGLFGAMMKIKQNKFSLLDKKRFEVAEKEKKDI